GDETFRRLAHRRRTGRVGCPARSFAYGRRFQESNMRKFAKSLLAVIAVALPGSAFAADYVIDPSHTSVGFTVRHLMVTKVRGTSEKVSGTVKYDPNEPEKIVIDATIDAASINTREAKRDEHLRSPDFFDVAKHPTLTFKSKKAKVQGKGKLEVIGDLTIRGVTKEVTLQ